MYFEPKGEAKNNQLNETESQPISDVTLIKSTSRMKSLNNCLQKILRQWFSKLQLTESVLTLLAQQEMGDIEKS